MTTQLNLGTCTKEQFLQRYWQQKPLLVRQAFAGFKSMISAEELAGLACEPEVESRILIEHGLDGQSAWQLLYGPQDEKIFSQLPKSHWTLLVQEANRYIPELEALIDEFDFIPRWRFDDVMISYAVQGGSVGPHSDQYDVFLLQAQGQRHWHIANYPVTDADLIKGIETRVLKQFYPQQDWVLNPGDMLYLPPGILHHGIALDDDCMTYSIGFRAPDTAELINGIMPYLIEKGLLQQRYSDPGISTSENFPHLVAKPALKQLQRMLSQLTQNTQYFQHAVACFLSESVHTAENEREENDKLTAEQLLANHDTCLSFNPDYRYTAIECEAQGHQFYINGEAISGGQEIHQLLVRISKEKTVRLATIKKQLQSQLFAKNLLKLINKHYLLLSRYHNESK